ncbi:MAG: sigma-54 interaction domain-containing protein, partial [Planctomycetota bacterium]
KEEERTIGVMYLDNRFRSAVFLDKDVALLTSLAQRAAAAVARARLYRRVLEERRRAEELSARLQDVNRELQERVQTQLLEIGEVRRKLRERDQELALRFSYENIIGRSTAMQKLFQLMDRVIDTDLPVLVVGPTGSGKELVAKTIHHQGRRRDADLVTENCAALPETLLESELFGYAKGAFTGAEEDKPGLLERADGGTLFLDEIGEMSLAMQAKLLRVLDQETIRRVGSEEPITLDLRIIAASNRDLARAVKEGRFREDLFYRLNTFTLHVPPLKKRPEDIPPLVDHFVAHFAQVKGVSKPKTPRRVMEALMNHTWPGNVRELKNEVERMVTLCETDVLDPADLSPALVRSVRARTSRLRGSTETQHFDTAVADFEAGLLQRALEENEWNVVQAAKQLGINRMKLARKIKKHGLKQG